MIESMGGTPYQRSAHPHRDGPGALLARVADALRTTDLTLLGTGPENPRARQPQPPR